MNWGPKRGIGIAVFFVLFALVVAALFATAGCSKSEPTPDSGIIRDKSHYAEAEIKDYDCKKDKKTGKQVCKLDDTEIVPEHCTLTIEEDITTKRSEVEIPCADLDSYKVGDWWLREGVKSPPPGRELP